MNRREILDRVHVAKLKLRAAAIAARGSYAARVMDDTLRGELEAIPSAAVDRPALRLLGAILLGVLGGAGVTALLLV